MLDWSAIQFGLIDNGVLALGMIFGVEWGDYLLPKRFKSKAGGAVVGGFIGNLVSDAVAGLAIGLHFTIGVTVGCFIPALLLPCVIKRATSNKPLRIREMISNA